MISIWYWIFKKIFPGKSNKPPNFVDMNLGTKQQTILINYCNGDNSTTFFHQDNT